MLPIRLISDHDKIGLWTDFRRLEGELDAVVTNTRLDLLIWLVDPGSRSVEVYIALDRVLPLREGERLRDTGAG
jgi:hypothetical protein